ncbi:MAG: 1-acyl-sn-glycerol-3-phosphate acyltransferase [Betaproteobacteria bacterium]|nr:1-acyl-sn-glycerol-3-phosphate acyltransferase [Betaproteobacteria bacterium]
MRMGILVVRGLITLRRFSLRTPAQQQDAIQEWSRRLLHLCRAQLEVLGEPHKAPCLLAVNHVSWLDIVALNAAHPTRFVAKADINRWILLGTLARGAGTLFIERERPRDAMRVMHAMAQALRNGQLISVFPEGTTSDGREILPMHANLFQAAISSKASVQPVLLRYLDARTGHYSRAPAYVGDETLLGTLWRMACAGPLRIRIQYLAIISGDDRRALAIAARAALQAELGPRNKTKPDATAAEVAPLQSSASSL